MLGRWTNYNPALEAMATPFHAMRCKNYATEAANLIANLNADWPRHIAYIVIHNHTVNTEGKPGKGKPIDQHMELYNL